jgi:hypothetical protein
MSGQAYIVMPVEADGTQHHEQETAKSKYSPLKTPLKNAHTLVSSYFSNPTVAA